MARHGGCPESSLARSQGQALAVPLKGAIHVACTGVRVESTRVRLAILLLHLRRNGILRELLAREISRLLVASRHLLGIQSGHTDLLFGSDDRRFLGFVTIQR